MHEEECGAFTPDRYWDLEHEKYRILMGESDDEVQNWRLFFHYQAQEYYRTLDEIFDAYIFY